MAWPFFFFPFLSIRDASSSASCEDWDDVSSYSSPFRSFFVSSLGEILWRRVSDAPLEEAAFLTGGGGNGAAGRASCAEDDFPFFFLGGSTCTLPVTSGDCCALGLSLGGALLGLFPLTISFFGTRLASWLPVRWNSRSRVVSK